MTIVIQCFIFGLVHVQSRDKFCNYWPKNDKRAMQLCLAREGVKIEHEKKLSTLQSQEYKGDDEVKLDKTKASIKRLQSLILVTSQAVSTTSSAINGLRDAEFFSQLVEL